jgi:hypothetical protein
MLTGLCNNKGFGMIDAVMAMCITLVGIAGLLAIMPIGWGLAGTSDMRTRGLEIMHRELENDQMLIMNPCNTIDVNTSILDKIVYSSGSTTALAGDKTFTVRKTIGPATTGWQIKVTVLWDGTTAGVSETRLVVRQYDYQDNANCATMHTNVSL